MHLGMAKCRVPTTGHCDIGLDQWSSSRIDIESGTDLLSSLKKEFQIWCTNASLDGGV